MVNTTEDIEQVIKQMRMQNMGYKMIANELGINRETVRYYCKKLGLTGVKGIVKEAKPKPKKKPISCSVCGKTIEAANKRKYCSTECRESKYKQEPITYTKECAKCRVSFVTTNHQAKYCGDECRFVTSKCNGCGKEFRSREEGKKYCSMKCIASSTKKSHEEYMAEFFNIHKGNIVPLELYQGSDIKLKAMCLHCGNEMSRMARQYIGSYKYGCKHCAHKSIGENLIAEWLDTQGIEYQRQHSFTDLIYKKPLYFDFAVIDSGEVKLLIEYDGEQHHEAIEFFGGEAGLEQTKERDNLKDEYTKQNNIHLLRINNKKLISKELNEFMKKL